MSQSDLRELLSIYDTPLQVYFEDEILKNGEELNNSFSWNEGFREFFAVKATPNPKVMKLLHEKLHFGMDCSSLAELLLCEKVGIKGEDIMFTSNNTQLKEYEKAIELGAIINLDDITHIDYIPKELFSKIGIISFRFNPGLTRSGNAIIGEPSEAKFGLTKDQLFQAYEKCLKLGVKRFGIHTMVVSNELDEEQFKHTADMLFETAVEIENSLNITFEFVNLGGGLGIPYKPEENKVDINKVSSYIQESYNLNFKNATNTPNVFMENGRYITGPYGYIISKIIHTKNTYKNYVGIDACMANLMRPGMYNAYHHISIIGKEESEEDEEFDVVGSLCENNDKFAINRKLSTPKIGDIVIIHDTGAHGHSMGFNYNGKLRSAEVLITKENKFELIRRAETMMIYSKH